MLFARVNAAPAVTATLTLPNHSVLPGVPFDLVVTYTNVSNKPITIDGARATLLVKYASGDTVVMNNPDVSIQWSIRGSMPARLGPGESVQHAASWENGSIPNWFHYGSSFSGPGTYGVALELSVMDEDLNVLGTIRTPVVTLTRVEPVGIDAELWKRLQAVSNGQWSDGSFAAKEPGIALADEIIQLHPISGYYPYVLALRSLGSGVSKSHIPALLEAVERFPNSPAYPYLLTAAANCARYAGTLAPNEGNSAEAEHYLALAAVKYREALATKSVAIRVSVERDLHDVIHRCDRTTKRQPR